MASGKIGLSLSGGGYRAAAFHLGTLRKLHDLGILQNVDVLSTISGGSIAGAYYCLNHADFKKFDTQLYGKLNTKNVIKGVILSPTFLLALIVVSIFVVPAVYFLSTDKAWLFPVLLLLLLFGLVKFQFIIFPVSKRIERIYDRFFYSKATLGQLPSSPKLVISSTNLQTGRLFTFSQDRMQDSTYDYLKDENGKIVKVEFKPGQFPIARAVMASSCVPFAFSPISIASEFFKDPKRDIKRVNPQLVDGGVYDNQGIHKVMQKGRYSCDFVITSDAGNKLDYSVGFRNTISLLIRTVDVFMARIKSVQMVQDVYENADTLNKEIAYLSLGWDVEQCIPGFIRNLAKKQISQSVIEAHQLKPEWIDKPLEFEGALTAHLIQRTNYNMLDKPDYDEKKIARSVPTNLTSLNTKQLNGLIKQASCLTELQVKLYCPTLLQGK